VKVGKNMVSLGLWYD